MILSLQPDIARQAFSQTRFKSYNAELQVPNYPIQRFHGPSLLIPVPHRGQTNHRANPVPRRLLA